jgi:hypothetical protein
MAEVSAARRRAPVLVFALLGMIAFASTRAAVLPASAAALAPGVVVTLFADDDVASCAKQVRAASRETFVHGAFGFAHVKLANGQDITLASAHTSCLCETATSKNCLKIALERSGDTYRNVFQANTMSVRLHEDGSAETISYASEAVSRLDKYRWKGSRYEPTESQTIANPNDPLGRWFNALTCQALDDLVSLSAPVVKTGHEELLVTLPAAIANSSSNSNVVPSYAYDPRAGVAFRHFGGDCCHLDTLRFVGKPPVRVPQADLSAARTTSGLKLGASASAVVAKLGKPTIVRACGLERYEYSRDSEGEPLDLDFTIRGGRVIEIFADTGG